jgi:hypothetical protein
MSHTGVEPVPPAWKADMHPIHKCDLLDYASDRIRTYVDIISNDLKSFPFDRSGTLA